MKYGAEYTVTDTRPEPWVGIATLQPAPDGLLVFMYGDGRLLTWDDDNPDAFIDDEESGAVIVVTEEGSVVFNALP